jgi:hypothetical protein
MDKKIYTHKYKRFNEDDRKIATYNPILLLLWDVHMNIKFVTKNGIVQYLVKYVSKVEPSQFVIYKYESSIKQFLELRNCGFNLWSSF